MFKNLSPGAIGIRNCTLADAIELARAGGFAGIDFSIREAADLVNLRGLEYVRDLFAQAGVRPGQWGLPVAWNRDDQWQDDLRELPKLAALGRALGCTRTATWAPPGSNERPFGANFEWHVQRFRPIAQILADEGCSLG
ncbi:MAG: sugar phosphate isomerase/epimerase, partial [Chloroflexi bacterium]|nr:sugar phosphate isomerase/epimerase [Chloroflexota bacterium]